MKIEDLYNVQTQNDTPTATDTQYELAIEFVEKYCTEILAEIKKSDKLLYRGIKKSDDDIDIFIGGQYAQRRVVNGSIQSAGDLCDLYLKTAGFTALRGNSTFCNSDKYDAMVWGKVFCIFPVNGFQFTYSKVYSGIPAYRYCFPPEDKLSQSKFRDNNANPLDSTELNNRAKKFVQDNEFRQTDLYHAMNYDRDVWLTGKFIAFRASKYGNDLINKFIG